MEKILQSKMYFSILAMVSGLILKVPAANAGEHFTTAEWSDVEAVVKKNVSRYGAERVLLALDIDNTTLETQTDFGSEQWFLWQSKLINEGRLSEGAIAQDIASTLALQAHIYQLSPMKPVDAAMPAVLSNFGRQGVKMLALTSRNLDTRDATLRELSLNNFPYESFSPGPRGGYAGNYHPYNLDQPEDYGLTAADVTKFSLQPSSRVSYDRGVFFTAGQHKGILLRTLLQKIEGNFDAIIFVDDRLRHSEGMQAAFESRREDVTTIQFTKNAEKISRFEKADKQRVIDSWCEFSRALQVTEGSLPRVRYFRPLCLK